MKFAVALWLIIFASPAFAIIVTGPPPWICHPYAVCEGKDVCISFYGVPMDFVLRKSERDEQLHVAEGTYGFQLDVKMLSSLEEARRFIQTHKPDRERVFPAILIPNGKIADAIGFDFRYTKRSASGERGINEKFLRFVCSNYAK